MEIVLQLSGVLLVTVVVTDIFLVVLFPASGHGLVQRPLAAGVWAVFESIASGFEAQRRRNFLSYAGPLIIGLNLTVWFGLLVAGWAMIYKPELGAEITASSGVTDTSWTTAIYYSGFNMTTLGMGDVTPDTGLFRVLTIVQAGMGFTFFSLTISYFLSIYPNLNKRNAVALSIYQLAGRSRDAKQLIVRQANNDDVSAVLSGLGSKIPDLYQAYEAQLFYPVLCYFHYREPYYALPYFLFILLDTTSLLRTVLDPRQHEAVADSPVLEDVYQIALSLGGATHLNDGRTVATDDEREAWQQHYLEAHAYLAEAGLSVRPDRDEGMKRYCEMRAQWSPVLAGLKT